MISLDDDKGRLQEHEKMLQEKISFMSTQVQLYRTEASSSASDLRSAMSKIFLLEKELEDIRIEDTRGKQNEKIKTLEELSTQLNSR